MNRLATRFSLLLVAALAAHSVSLADGPAVPEGSALVFTSFRGNGDDGLHLAASRDGYTWTALNGDRPIFQPKVGGGLVRDPNIVQGPDGLFHMVWTTGWTHSAIGYAHSKDLIHWSEARQIVVMQDEPRSRNVWAPELFYDDKNDRFLIFWASTIPGRFPETETTGDDGYNHRTYMTATKDFETFTPTKLFYEPGFNSIDATIVRDGDRYAMFIKDETLKPPAKNLRVAFADAPSGPFGPPSPPITGDFWAEGASAIKLGDRWFLYFDRYVDHRYGLVTSTDLVHWNDESDRVRFPADFRHGSVLLVPSTIRDGLEALGRE
ncbi:glycoside hydrolase family 43 protein [Planctomyces sp. SH-PL62]|uniref:glycoside hydrolase family 43 protein n=1 Tax=Planctomyces sp. SH-PL62 TaxID=1636152 RepID=UPI00078E9AFF|nr:glycoside hydrolase family 43 protein [Planctomyces sp. SH-PL62]AMV37607.1 Glycosyl hydrolases family 43 [Planctomyces sp. SH-PL62]